MKQYSKYTNFILALIILLPFLACTQNKKANNPSDINIEVVAKEIMTNANTCALITDTNYIPRVRMMGSLKPEPHFTVWFGTNPNSRKVAQIKHNP